MKHLDAITSSVEEEEEMAGEEILVGEGLADESGQTIEAFSEVHGLGVEEDPHGVREVQHEGSSRVADERATVSTTWQTRSVPAAIGRRIWPPLGSWNVTRSAAPWDGEGKAGGTITGTNVGPAEEKGVGDVERRASRRFQEWKVAAETPSRLQNCWIVRPLRGCCRRRRRQRDSGAGSAGRGIVGVRERDGGGPSSRLPGGTKLGILRAYT